MKKLLYLSPIALIPMISVISCKNETKQETETKPEQDEGVSKPVNLEQAIEQLKPLAIEKERKELLNSGVNLINLNGKYLNYLITKTSGDLITTFELEFEFDCTYKFDNEEEIKNKTPYIKKIIFEKEELDNIFPSGISNT